MGWEGEKVMGLKFVKLLNCKVLVHQKAGSMVRKEILSTYSGCSPREKLSFIPTRNRGV